jgi:Tol biopolymer transport system component
VWSPDSRRLAFVAGVRGQRAIDEKPVTGGADDETRLVSSEQQMNPVDWSADGRFLLYGTATENTGWDLWALPLTGERKAFPVVQTRFNEELGQLSRDGRWIAYQSNESGRTEGVHPTILENRRKIIGVERWRDFTALATRWPRAALCCAGRNAHGGATACVP